MSDSELARLEPIKFWPLWTTIGFPLLLIALNATPLAPNFVFVMLGIPVLILMWTVSGVCAGMLAIRALKRHRWMQVSVAAVLPLVLVGIGLRFLVFIHLCNAVGDELYFVFEHRYFVRAIHTPPPQAEPRLLVFNRGGMIWASSGLVYDESDEVVRDPSLQSSDWKKRAQNSELGCGYGAQPFLIPFAFTRHWYTASFAC
jgi:hypothetical protein